MDFIYDVKTNVAKQNSKGELEGNVLSADNHADQSKRSTTMFKLINDNAGTATKIIIAFKLNSSFLFTNKKRLVESSPQAFNLTR
jgi:hypothetical protein